MFLSYKGKQTTSKTFISRYYKECKRAIELQHASEKAIYIILSPACLHLPFWPHILILADIYVMKAVDGN